VADFKWDPPSTSVQLDQNGCHYRPHVLGIQVNQKLSITNSDPTRTTFIRTPKQSRVEPVSTKRRTADRKTFARSEVLIPVKCNQHPWMKSYIGVLKTPFFAVSKEDGSFTISGVPAGTYTTCRLERRRPGWNREDDASKVDANGTAKADFTFEAAAAAASAQPTSLQVLPAVEFPMLGRPH
jgi:hypothetical protein